MAGNGLDIGMEDVFGYIQGMPYILVGILDTGIDITHDELNCSIFSNDKEIHANNIDDDGNGYIDDTKGWDFYNKTPLADFESGNNSHGTHIAGIISAKADNSGIMGIAPGVVILPLKFMQGDFGYTSDAIEAIHYAEAMGASILNSSWGSKYSNYALYEAISNSNMLFVSAAGNSSSKEAVYPAAYDLPNVISVGSVNSRGELSSISNYGPKVDIFAEGENILSTLPSNTYGEMSGTSISTAFVAAAAALVKAYNYTACAEELKYRLKTYTTPNTFDQSYETSAGILNVLAAMTGDTYDFTPSKPRENKQLEYLTQYIIQNCNTFSSIETKHKNEFLARTRLKEEDFLLCESLGLSLADSFSIIKSISKNSVLSIADALALYKLKHKDMESYINEVARFNIFTFRYLGSKDTDFYVEALLKYGNANAIRAAYVVSKSLDIAFEEVYTDKKEVIVKDMVDRSLKLTGEDINILNEMLELFPVNGARILEYIKSSGRKPNEIYEAVKESEINIAEKNGEILRPLSSQAPSFDKYSYAPFTYTKEKNETINTSSGSLRITDNILTLKGRNGMDLDLSLVYDSSMSNLYEPGYYAVTDYSYVIWLTYKVNVLSISGTIYYTYDNVGWVYDSTYYNYQNALQRASQLGTLVKTNDLYNVSYFERYHYNTRILYYNENGVLTSIGPWSNLDGSILYPNGYPVAGYTPNLPRTGTITGDQNNPYYVYWPNGKVKEKHETWIGVYSGYATSINPVGYEGYYYSTSISEYANNTYYNTTNANTYRERSKFGAGWAIELPGIEFSSQGGTVLHLNGLQYKYKYTADTTDSNLEGYTLKDIRLEPESGVYSNGVSTSLYTLYHKDGKKDYFDSNGLLIGSKDRHGNEIKYRYTTFAGHNVLNKIIDSVGREINISYTDSGAQREIKITIANTNFEVKYLLQKIPGENPNDCQLVRKTDEGNRHTQYQYTFSTSYFNLMSKTTRNTYNKYALLSRITYPSNGSTEYTYAKYIENLGTQGTQENFRIEIRKEVAGGKEYNKKTYSYSQDNYTGYPSLPDPSNLVSSFSYWTASTDNNGFETKITFNYKHLPTSIKKTDNGMQKEINTISYNSDRLPILSIKTAFDPDGSSLSTVENYAYDQYRNITGYWGPLSNRDASNNPANDEHKTTYSYNSMFHVKQRINCPA